MTQTVVVAGAALIGLAVLGFGWLYYRAVAGGWRAYEALTERLQPVAEALAKGETPSSDLLLQFAENRETRKVLFDVLAKFGKTEIFPERFRTWEMMAEADLVAWLCHPNELGVPPSEIELVTWVPAPGPHSQESFYLLFRFRTAEPHWAAKDGWLAGVVGPCMMNESPTPHNRGTFSRFEQIDSRLPAGHVTLAHTATHGVKPQTLRAAS